MKNGVIKSDWFTGLIITLIFLIFAGSDFIASMERNAYDFGVQSSSRIPSNKIAIIAIDDQSINNIGRWPWSRDIHARMHDILAQGGVKAVGQTVFFSEPQLDPGLQFIRELKQVFENSSMANAPELVEALALSIEDTRKLVKNKRDVNGQAAVQKIADALEASPLRQQIPEEIAAYLEYINTAEVVLDTDNVLAKSMNNAGNIVFNMPFVPGQPNGEPDAPLPTYIAKNQLIKKNIIDNAASNPNGFTPLPMIDAYQAIAILGEQASTIGALVSLPDVDGGIRTEPLVIDYYGQLYPSMALLLAAKSLNLGIEDIRITVGSSVQLGRLNIKTDGHSLINTFFYDDDEYYSAFPVDSFFDVRRGKFLPINTKIKLC